MKADIIPAIRIASSVLVNVNPNLMSFKRLAPNIVGMAKKNVNSAATYLEVPINMAPIMVAPDLEVPGKMDKT